MKVTVERVDDVNFIIKGTAENSLVLEKVAALKKAAQDLQEDASDEKLEQQAATQVFKEFIAAGIEEAGIGMKNLLGQPGLKKYEKQGDDIYFEVELATVPQINTDIEYADIIPSFTKPKATPEAVEAKLAEFMQQQAPFIKIEEARAVAAGDVALIDFKGFVDGEAFEGGSAEKFKLKIGSGSFIPGFEDQVIGMQYGQEKTITVTFPNDYQSKDLAGKETKFEIKLHEIQEQKAQTPDDAFAQSILNDTAATVETLKSKLADQVISQALTELYNSELKPQLIEGLLSKFDFTLPNNIVEQEIDAKVREKLHYLSKEEQTQYIEDKEKFLALRDSVRQEARDGIKIAMIVEVLAEKEGVTVDEQEVISALSYQAMMTGQDAQALVKYYQDNNLMHSAKLGLTEDKLFGKILGFDRQ